MVRPFVRLRKATCRWRWVWSNTGMMTERNRMSGSKTWPSATLSTTNLIWTDFESNPPLRAEKYIYNGPYREYPPPPFYLNTMTNQLSRFVICSRQWTIFKDNFVGKIVPLAKSHLLRSVSVVLNLRGKRQNPFYTGFSRFWAQLSLVCST